MKLVYIAGPFRGLEKADSHWQIAQNIRRAEALALEVWRLGGVAICPHLNTAHFQNECPDHIWLEGDLEMLRRCDAILLTPDFHLSKGAVAEMNYALKNQIQVFHSVGGYFAEWLKTPGTRAIPAL